MWEEGAPVRAGEVNSEHQHHYLLSLHALWDSRLAAQMRKLSSERLCFQVQSVPLPERAAPGTNGDTDIQHRHWVRWVWGEEEPGKLRGI